MFLIRLINGDNVQNSSDMNQITEIYCSRPKSSSAEILSMFQQRVASKSAIAEVQKIRATHEQFIQFSFSSNQEEFDQLLAKSSAFLSSTAITDTNPSDFYVINRLHTQLKFATNHLSHYKILITRVKMVQSAFKSAMRISLSFLENQPDPKEFQRLVEQSIDEIGIKELLENLELGKNEWQKEVNSLNHQIYLQGFPLAAHYNQSSLEDYLLPQNSHDHFLINTNRGIYHEDK